MTADALQRAYLEARRAHWAGQLDRMRELALGLWRKARERRADGGDLEAMEALAMDAEEACYRVNVALMAIDDELGEGGKE